MANALTECIKVYPNGCADMLCANYASHHKTDEADISRMEGEMLQAP